MKSLVFSQFAIVKANTAALFTLKLNEEVYRLKDKEPNVKFSEADPLCAYIEYTENEQQPETIEEVEALEGIRFVCEQCPHFHPILKADETVDERCKHGDCDYIGNELGRTMKRSAACPRLYEILQGDNAVISFKEPGREADKCFK